jgi:tellurite methyltransferase
LFSKPVTPTWDERYRKRPASTEPSALLRQFSEILPSQGTALDLACGAGRNSVFLAQRGLRVTGVDSSREALEKGRELALQSAVEAEWVEADLESFELPHAAFDLAIVFYYRDPRLYPRLRAAVRPGGLVIYQTFTREQLKFETGPRNPEHLLAPGELIGAFGGWDVVFYRETIFEQGLASLVAQKPKG